jgi:Sulfotransferase domain
MLLLANGAYKSGSTWLFRIVHELTGFSLPPKPYHRPGWEGTGVKPEMLKQFLDEVDYANHNYTFKAHVFFRYHLLAGRPNVKVLNVTRDTRDVIVSAFHYERMKGRYTGDDFSNYYWTKGRHVVHFVTHYNRLWARANNSFCASYEALLNDFENEVRRITAFIGFDATDEAIEKVKQSTSLDQMRAKYNEVSKDGTMQFYRKGGVGDWQNHFKEAELADLAKIERRHENFPNWMNLVVHRLRGELRRAAVE